MSRNNNRSSGGSSTYRPASRTGPTRSSVSTRTPAYTPAPAPTSSFPSIGQGLVLGMAIGAGKLHGASCCGWNHSTTR